MTSARVVKAWAASYAPALRVKHAEQVFPGKMDDEFPGWQWVENNAGLGGWVPAELIGPDGRMLAEFDTAELTVSATETVTRLQRRLGWSLCQSPGGDTGWLPDFCLES